MEIYLKSFMAKSKRALVSYFSIFRIFVRSWVQSYLKFDEFKP